MEPFLAGQACPGVYRSVCVLDLPDPRHNQLLGALPAQEWGQLQTLLEWVPLELGQVLYEPGRRQAYAYFPVSSIVSMLYVLENGASAEVAIVGNEGMLGISLFMGGATTPNRAVVQSAGGCYRMGAQALQTAFGRGGFLMRLLLRYTQALMNQMTQTAVCNRHHVVEQQFCRWLLFSLDRIEGDTLTMTQELIANMLGVRRESVTEVAGRLQRDGLIRYARGRITVQDRPALEQRVCECYGVVQKEFVRLMAGVS